MATEAVRTAVAGVNDAAVPVPVPVPEPTTTNKRCALKNKSFESPLNQNSNKQMPASSTRNQPTTSKKAAIKTINTRCLNSLYCDKELSSLRDELILIITKCAQVVSVPADIDKFVKFLIEQMANNRKTRRFPSAIFTKRAIQARQRAESEKPKRILDEEECFEYLKAHMPSLSAECKNKPNRLSRKKTAIQEPTRRSERILKKKLHHYI